MPISITGISLHTPSEWDCVRASDAVSARPARRRSLCGRDSFCLAHCRRPARGAAPFQDSRRLPKNKSDRGGDKIIKRCVRTASPTFGAANQGRFTREDASAAGPGTGSAARLRRVRSAALGVTGRASCPGRAAVCRRQYNTDPTGRRGVRGGPCPGADTCPGPVPAPRET